MTSLAARTLILAYLATAACGSPDSNRTLPPTNASISSDELAIYEAVIETWSGNSRRPQRVNRELSAAPSDTDPEFKECSKGLDLAGDPAGTQGRKSLEGVRFKRTGIELIDGADLKPSRPSSATTSGKPVVPPVREDKPRSLISFSTITFSRDRNDALVKFAEACGGLCGSGFTARLHKSASGWTIVRRCGEWIA